MHKKFQARIDSLSSVKMCQFCNECYLGIHAHRWHEGPICLRCMREKGTHHFSRFKNMDPGEKPDVLRVLTQV